MQNINKLLVISIWIIVFNVLIISCQTSPDNADPLPLPNLDFRQKMRDFVIDLSEYSKNIESNFLILPQNGQELVTDNGEGNGTTDSAYLAAIDATGRESMFYGYYKDNEITPSEDKQHLLDLCLVCEDNNVEVLTTDYCSDHTKMDNSYQINSDNSFISFAADQRDLNNIPIYPAPIYNQNTTDITDISQAKNFLYLINSENFEEKDDFITAVSATNYDVIIMDLYHNEEAYTSAEIDQLKNKNSGGTRLVYAI